MQIHELNNFTGTLGSGAYLAVDDGNDTGKLSTQQLLAATEARIDNIIAGPAPSAEEIVDARLGDDGVTYPSLGDAIRDQVGDLKSAINEIVNFDDYITNIGYQYLKASEKTTGYYYNISGSSVVKGGGGTSRASIYKPFKLKKSVTYYYTNLYAYFCIVDTNGTLTRLSESSSSGVTGSFTPSEDCVIYVSIHEDVAGSKSFRTTLYIPHGTAEGIYNASLSTDGYLHISIKTDGTGDYTSPVSAVRQITDSSEKKQYMLDIYEGTYPLAGDLGPQEKQGSIWGLTLPDYVHMRGIGNRDNIIINCSLPNNSASTDVEYTSTVNLKQNNSLENLTFTGTNVRYVVHDESSNTYKNWKRIVKNCKFIHYGNAEGFWAYTYAWGEGCSSGSYSYFEDCIFENYSYVPPFGFHTNTDFDSACTHIFKNCQFVQNYNGNDSAGSFTIKDLQCGKPINVEFVGCMFSRFIFVENYASATDIEELNITGYGNNPVVLNVYRPNVATAKRIFTKFSDEVSLVYNNSNNAIAMGRPLNYASYANNKVGVPQSSGTWVCGVALDEIPAQGLGYMQYAGILPLASVGISGISIGDKVGVSNWSIAKVTDGTEFARAIQNNVIKFI